ncbi:MAG: GNAT family N-acetyltransferase [Clostridiales Family XIII bacterium]|nr:GNAT family N-acetyltransferase [Clostridiales Family XIII bacterium]
MEYIRLTEKNRSWFAPLLDDAQKGLWTAANHYALGAADRGKACGLLIFHWTGESADIVHLAVADAFRRRGVATGLVQCLCRHAYAVTAPVTADFAASDKSDPLYLLFANMDNFTVSEDEGGIFRLSCGEIQESRRMKEFLPPGAVIVPFFSLPEWDRKRFCHTLAAQNIPYAREWEDHRPRMSEDLCLCWAEEEVEAAVFVERTAERELSPAFVWSGGRRQNRLFGLLAETEKRIAESGEEGDFVIAATTEKARKLVEKLYPRARMEETFFRAVWDMTVEEDR